jgi:DNA mismatch repair protein MutL
VCTTLAERMTEIFGRQLAGGLLPVAAGAAGLRLGGLIGPPGMGRGTRHEMITFVNRRPVDSRTLNYALIESYHTLLPKGRYPVAVLFLELDPAAVDVNVHPAKREVRFRDESAVRAFVMRTVLERLRHGPCEALADNPRPRLAEVPAPAPPPVPPAPAIPPESRIAAPFPAFRPAMPPPAAAGVPPVSPAAPAAPPPPAPVPAPSGLRPAAGSWRFLGLAHRECALFETAAGLMLLDRRAAHERVWFERLEDQFRAGAVATQRLLLPVPVELDPIASALLLDRLAFLHRHGFEIAEFGRNFFRIEGVPVWLEAADAEAFLRDLLGAFRDGRLDEHNPALARAELARLAAGKAIRLPESVNETEIHALVAQLFACRQPLTSPAGRLTHLEISHAELARRFQK